LTQFGYKQVFTNMLGHLTCNLFAKGTTHVYRW